MTPKFKEYFVKKIIAIFSANCFDYRLLSKIALLDPI